MIPVCSDELVAHFCCVNAADNSSHGAWPHSIYNHTYTKSDWEIWIG